jgi:hypothetical protein
VCLPWNAAGMARFLGMCGLHHQQPYPLRPLRRGSASRTRRDEGGWETLKGGELVGSNLCQAAHDAGS